jgi:hypothetical protein
MKNRAAMELYDIAGSDNIKRIYIKKKYIPPVIKCITNQLVSSGMSTILIEDTGGILTCLAMHS